MNSEIFKFTLFAIKVDFFKESNKIEKENAGSCSAILVHRGRSTYKK